MKAATPVHLVWFKRDLRMVDHAALAAACRAGPVLPLYIAEPSVWQAADASAWHWGFVEESLTALGKSLAELGLPLLRLRGEAVDVLEALRQALPLAALYSHQDSGHACCASRDQAVAAWCEEHALPWHRFALFGAAGRTAWAERYAIAIQQPLHALPERILAPHVPPLAHAPARWQLFDPGSCRRQHGGRGAGLALLASFLDKRVAFYPRGQASPLTASDACSRLSPHLAWGTLSLREVEHARRQRLAQLDPLDRHSQRLRAGLDAFAQRLRWHGQARQTISTLPGCDTAPTAPLSADLLCAWSHGETGYPLVDASLAMLHATGWLNHRLRALLIQLASHALQLPWPTTGQYLARRLVDYQPDIHWAQVQQHASPRAARQFNPVAQALELDPQGVFVARWLPALAKVPVPWRCEPWKMPLDVQQHCGVRIGRDYPAPCVDWAASRAQAPAPGPVRRSVRSPGVAPPPSRLPPRQTGPGQLALGF